MPGSNAGTGQPIHFFCSKCRKRGEHRFAGSSGHRNGWSVIRTGRTKPYRGGNRGIRGLATFHEYKCVDCEHVGWSRHVDMRDKPVGWYVEIVEKTTGHVDKRMGPMHESKADKVEMGVLMRINEDFFVRTGTAEALAKEAAAR